MTRNLINKSYKEYSYISRYSPFPYYFNKQDNKYVYGITAYLNTNTAYTIHKVSQNDTFDSLALKYYNNPTLYWVICSFNRIQDPYKHLEAGTLLKIPALSDINFNTTGRK